MIVDTFCNTDDSTFDGMKSLIDEVTERKARGNIAMYQYQDISMNMDLYTY